MKIIVRLFTFSRLGQLPPRLEQLVPKLERLAPKIEQLALRLEQLPPRLEQLVSQLEQLSSQLEAWIFFLLVYKKINLLKKLAEKYHLLSLQAV